MDFGALPPEINSALMYGGAGATPMLVAAAAWNGIAVELSTAAASFESVVMRLSSEHWTGYASSSMAVAAQPVVGWMTAAAESSARVAEQAMASAAAFESAYAMTVPPPVVAANRAQLAALLANNTFGQNVPAIAATEARYGEMWAQDAAAMYGYAASSAVAGRLDPLTSPSEVTNPAGIANQAAAVGQAAASGSAEQLALSSLISNGPAAITSLAAPAAAESSPTTVLEFVRWLDSNEHPFWASFDHNRATYWDYTLGWPMGGDEEEEVEAIADAGVPGALPPSVFARPITAAAIGPAPPVAGVGNASLVGGLSVPPRWATAAPEMTISTAARATGWAVPEDEEAFDAVAPGMVADASDAGVGAGPRYGVKPTVMPKQGLF